MRLKRTNAEEWAIGLMKDELEKQGYSIKTNNEITDSPDWAFKLNSENIAAECTYINPELLMEWSNQNKPSTPNIYYNSTFAFEPHYWVQKAVEAKEGKISKYLKNAEAKKAWLILHGNIDEPYEWYDCDNRMIEIMNQAARAIQPKFDQIWFLHSESKITVKNIWKKGEPKANFPDVFNNGKYPTFKVSKVRSFDLSDKLPLKIEETEEELIIKPISPHYSIDDY